MTALDDKFGIAPKLTDAEKKKIKQGQGQSRTSGAKQGCETRTTKGIWF